MSQGAARKKAGRSRTRSCVETALGSEAVVVHELPVELAVFDGDAWVAHRRHRAGPGYRRLGRITQCETHLQLLAERAAKTGCAGVFDDRRPQEIGVRVGHRVLAVVVGDAAGEDIGESAGQAERGHDHVIRDRENQAADTDLRHAAMGVFGNHAALAASADTIRESALLVRIAESRHVENIRAGFAHAGRKGAVALHQHAMGGMGQAGHGEARCSQHGRAGVLSNRGILRIFFGKLPITNIQSARAAILEACAKTAGAGNTS